MTRADNDTWDLASSVGATATLVAAARAIATNAAKPLINDPFAEPLVRAVGVDFFTKWISGDIDAADLDESSSGWQLSFMADAMAVRTRFFDAFFADASATGIRQAVILASGLDARAYRLDWPEDMTLFEIDQPQVIEFKTRTLAALGATPATALRSVPIDLRDAWTAALRGAGFDSAQPTAWIAEGLLGYLPPDAQDRLLDDVTALSAAGSRLAVEAVPEMSATDVDQARDTMRRATAKWRDHGIDVEFSDLGYGGERHDIADYLALRGWRSVATTTRQLLAEHGANAIAHTSDSVSVADTVYYTSTLS